MKDKLYTITLIGIIIDQVTKYIVKANMHLLEKIIVIPNFFSISYVENSGAAFSILERDSYLLIFISLGVLLYLVNYINKEEKHLNLLYSTSLGMILGGIVGNLVDRILYHEVTDFLAFKIFNYNFPVFNFADVLIVVGVIILIVGFIKEELDKRGGYHGSRNRRREKKA